MQYKDILQSQKCFYNTNATKDIYFRINQLKYLKFTLIKNEDKLYEALAKDLGKSKFETILTELLSTYTEIDTAIKKLKKWSKRKKVRTNIANFPATSYIITEPLGCCLIISAWNYPYQLSLIPAISAIAAGNTVILKPSEVSANASTLMAEIINNEFEQNFFYVAEGGVEETTELLSLHFDKIFYTGNSIVAKIVAKAAANNLTPVTLELGGKSPAFIDDSCDLKISVQRLVWAKFLNAGQTCVAPDYVLLDKKIEIDFLKELKHNINKYYKTHCSDASNYTRIINEKHFDRIIDLIDKDKIFIGGNIDKENLFISPTIIRNINWEDKIMQEEIFGPLLPIITYDKIEDVIKEVKKKDKPLALYIFSKNKRTINKILEEISFGGGCVNDALMHLSNINLPFGGVGNSGMGSYHGEYGFKNFSHQKAILHKSFLFELSMKYFPYTNKKLSCIKKLL